jgi:hypothetical protein
MPSTQVTLVGGVAAVVPLDAPAGRVVVTLEAGTAAEVYVSVDGTLPVIPGNNVEVPGGQIMLASAFNSQAILAPPLFGDHMAIPTIRLLSAGTPVVSVAW